MYQLLTSEYFCQTSWPTCLQAFIDSSNACKPKLVILDSVSALITPILGAGGSQQSQGHALMSALGPFSSLLHYNTQQQWCAQITWLPVVLVILVQPWERAGRFSPIRNYSSCDQLLEMACCFVSFCYRCMQSASHISAGLNLADQHAHLCGPCVCLHQGIVKHCSMPAW